MAPLETMTGRCFNNQCVAVVLGKDVVVNNRYVTKIKATSKIIIPIGFVLEVKTHTGGKYWHVATKYIFPTDGTLCIPILASRPVTLKERYITKLLVLPKFFHNIQC